MRWCRAAVGPMALVLAAAIGSCFSTVHWNYRARAAGEREEAERVVVERAGVRGSAGPPAELPYVIERSGGAVERGRYQLFTRLRVESRRRAGGAGRGAAARTRRPGAV